MLKKLLRYLFGSRRVCEVFQEAPALPVVTQGRVTKKKKKDSTSTIVTAQPILVSLGPRSLSVATLVVVSDGVDIWVALRFSYHLYYMYTSTSLSYIVSVRQGRC